MLELSPVVGVILTSLVERALGPAGSESIKVIIRRENL